MTVVKKAVCLLLVSAMLIGTLPAMSFAADTQFQDVPGNAWYYDAVSYVSENGIMAGTADNQFSPEMEVTRAQMCQILYNMEDKPANSGSAFSDVNSADWFYSAVNWAASVGIVSGVGAGKFAPNTPITREQAMTILYNYASYKGYDVTAATGLEGFVDASQVSSWANTAMQWAVGSGYLSGVSETELQPYGTTTRAQMAMVLMRFSEKNNPSATLSTKPVNTGGAPGINTPGDTPSDDEPPFDEALLQEFKEKDIDDFPGYEILNFDESQETNFAVLKEGTVVTSTIGTTNQLTQRDEENGIFVIENISDDIANLKAGDVFYFSYGNTTDDYILLIVDGITVENGTATITADSDTQLSDYYEYVDIDMDIEIPGDSDEEEVQLFSVSTQNDDYGNIKNPSKTLPITLIDIDSLTVTDQVTVTATIYYYPDKESPDEIDKINYLTLMLKQEFFVEISAGGNYTYETKSKPHSINFGYGFKVSFYAKPVFEVTAKSGVTASFTVVSREGFSIDYIKGTQTKVPKKQDISIKDENVTIGVGFTCSVGAEATVSLDWTILSTGLTARATFDLTGTIGKDLPMAGKRHDCDICISIKTSFSYKISADISIKYWNTRKPVIEVVLYPTNSVPGSIPLSEYYISFQNGKTEFAKGTCPHYSYQTAITITDQGGKPIPSASLTISGGSIGNVTATTDVYGQYKNYFPNGTYKIYAKHSDFKEASDSFTVSGGSVSKTIKLVKNDDKGDPDEEKPPVENPPEVSNITSSQIADIMFFDTSSGAKTQAYIIDENKTLWMCEHDGTSDTDEPYLRNYKFSKIMEDVSAVSCGMGFAAAIKSDGTLWTWGVNNYGQLGTGDYTKTDTPVKVLDNVTSVSCGEYHTAAIKSDGSLWAWGLHNIGGLNDKGTNVNPTPRKVADDIIAVGCGEAGITAIINSENELWAWANFSVGPTGDVSLSSDDPPQKLMDGAVSVDVNNYTCNIGAIKSDGSLWTWGVNHHGQLGDSTKEHRFTPVKIMDNIAAVSFGGNFAAAIKTDGSLWTWGYNGVGTLGIGNFDSEEILVPTQVADLEDMFEVNCGPNNVIAISKDGHIYDWGLAFNTSDKVLVSPTPTQIQGIIGNVPSVS